MDPKRTFAERAHKELAGDSVAFDPATLFLIFQLLAALAPVLMKWCNPEPNQLRMMAQRYGKAPKIRGELQGLADWKEYRWARRQRWFLRMNTHSVVDDRDLVDTRVDESLEALIKVTETAEDELIQDILREAGK